MVADDDDNVHWQGGPVSVSGSTFRHFGYRLAAESLLHKLAHGHSRATAHGRVSRLHRDFLIGIVQWNPEAEV